MALDFRASQFRGAKFISSGSTGTGARILFYDISADSPTTPNIGVINSAKFGTGSIGTDVFLYVSGTITSGSGDSISVFGGSVAVSGVLRIGNSSSNYISQSGTEMVFYDGVVSGASLAKLERTYITVGSYTATTSTSSNPQVAGQAVLSQSEVGSTDIRLRSVLSTTTGSVTASLRLYNITSASYVEIGGPGVTTLFTVSQTPVQLQSINLRSAINFGTGSNIYECQVHIETGSQRAILGSSMFVSI